MILLAALVNIRLAALLPWRKGSRRFVLVRIQKLYLAGKCIEDLPQLTIAAVYLVQRSSSGELAGASVGTAVLQVVISGASFLLTLIWLCLQVADSARMKALRRDSSLFYPAASESESTTGRGSEEPSLYSPSVTPQRGGGGVCPTATEHSEATRRLHESSARRTAGAAGGLAASAPSYGKVVSVDSLDLVHAEGVRTSEVALNVEAEASQPKPPPPSMGRKSHTA